MSNKSGVSEQVISLPEGGGALKGIGETFSADLHTGTGNFTVPIDLPAGRNDFGPELSLTYSTGNGNSAFGQGWQLSVPGVSRKTSDGVPIYDNTKDTFLLSGAEDLVPVERNEEGDVTIYRPRTEGLFARIVHHRNSKDDYWTVHSKDGLVSTYGTAGSRGIDSAVIADPKNRTKVFAWRLKRTEDPFGNEIVYEYDRDLGKTDERHWDQTYLKRIKYIDVESADGGGSESQYLVSVDFEYEQRSNETDRETERPDPFSDYSAGFEIRTRKRCKEITVTTHGDEDGTYDADGQTIRRYNLIYQDERSDQRAPLNGVSLLGKVEVTGHKMEGGVEDTQQLPPLEFGYSEFDPQDRNFDPVEGDLPTRSLANPDLELADLDANGLPDIVEMSGTVRYWRNLGNGEFDEPRMMREAPTQARLAEPGVQMMDMDGDAQVDLMVSGNWTNGPAGYFSLQPDGGWDEDAFQRFEQAPSFSLEDSEAQPTDLTGDGSTDVIRSGTRLEHFFSDREEGWNDVRAVSRKRAEAFPDVSFSDPRVRLGGISGSGLQDIVLLHDGNVEYWPNLGHGNWGRRIHMRNSPRFPSGYDPRRILLGDVNGDGCADLVYVDDDRVLLWINKSGNAWSDRIEIEGTPSVTDMDAVRLVDLKGSGIQGILWSADARSFRHNMFFLDFTEGTKPYVLNEMDNHMGAVTRVKYEPSTRFYLEDQQDRETRWQTTLPFPVQVVSQVETIDQISENKLTTVYRYHQGYWDGGDREFRGFGFVEQEDTTTFNQYNEEGLHDEVSFEHVDDEHFSEPTLTKTWFHQGPVGDEFGEWSEVNHEREYWSEDPQVLSSPADRQANLQQLGLDRRRDRRDALRALRGSVLRTELYAIDDGEQDRPYTVTETAYEVVEKQPPEERSESLRRPSGEDPRHIFSTYKTGERTTQWERGDDPMTQFAFTGDYDDYGQPRSQISIAVPRKRDYTKELSSSAEAKTKPYLATLTRTAYVDPSLNDEDQYIVDCVASSTTYEIMNDGRDDVFTLKTAIEAGECSTDVIAQTVNFYDGSTGGEFRGQPYGEIGDYGALIRTEELVLTDEILQEAYSEGKISLPNAENHPYFEPRGTAQWPQHYPEDFRGLLQGSTSDGSVDATRPGLSMTPLGYGVPDGAGTDSPFVANGYYVATERRKYDFHESSGKSRGQLAATRGPRGDTTTIEYDSFDLLPIEVTDAVGLTTTASYDYRVLQPVQVTDPNGNRTHVRYTPLGLPESIAVMGGEDEQVGDTLDEPGFEFDAPGTQFIYDFAAFEESPPDYRQPINVHTIKREQHAQGLIRAKNEKRAETGQPPLTDAEIRDLFPRDQTAQILELAEIEQYPDRFIQSREYSDGFGRLVQTRTQAEECAFGDGPFGGFDLDENDDFPKEVTGTSVSNRASPRVVVSGWKTFDNKGRVVEQYEPFYDEGWDYLSRSEAKATEAQGGSDQSTIFGAGVRTYYDPRGQPVRTVNPDGSEQRVVHGIPDDLTDPERFKPSPWEIYTYDENDNAGRTHGTDSKAPTHHWNTPSSAVVDALGRTIETVERTREKEEERLEEVSTKSTYDIRGNPLTITDALERTAFKHVYDLANSPLLTDSIDAGERLIVRDAAGNEVERRDSKEALTLRAYDALNRSTHVWARDGKEGDVTLRERLVYGDDTEFVSTSTAEAGNLSSALYMHYDEAGLLTFDSYDFKGNVEEKKRRVLTDDVVSTPSPVDWGSGDRVSLESREAQLLEDEGDMYETSFEYDGLNRPVRVVYPKDVTDDRKVLRPEYNRAGTLKRVELRSNTGTVQESSETFVDHIAYDAKGQRTLVTYGNGVMTRYAYDTETFRLDRMRSETYESDTNGYRATGDQPGGDLYQNFTYRYDLVGNIKSINDQTPHCGVQDTMDRRHELDRKFEYDPLYRLVYATGRECTALLDERPMTDYTPCGHQPPGTGKPEVNRKNAPERTVKYWERYNYDAVGNMTRMRHGAQSDDRNKTNPSWTRHLTVKDKNNQLKYVGSSPTGSDKTHTYDKNGNLTVQTTGDRMVLDWNHADRLRRYRDSESNPSKEAFYCYDASGQRVKKVVEKTGRTESTVYVDDVFEHHRLKTIGETRDNNSLNVMDDQKRIATVRVGEPFDDGDIYPSVQYHFGDHLESSNVVVGGDGGWVSFEEYSPYGETTFGGFSRKRYRYTGKERDEESGLYYHGARYYAPWLAKWASCDSTVRDIAINLYTYTRNNPIRLIDPTGSDSKPPKNQAPNPPVNKVSGPTSNMSEPSRNDRYAIDTYRNQKKIPQKDRVGGKNIQAHHPTQVQWAKNNIIDYSSLDAPTQYLETEGSANPEQRGEHTIISTGQDLNRPEKERWHEKSTSAAFMTEPAEQYRKAGLLTNEKQGLKALHENAGYFFELSDEVKVDPQTRKRTVVKNAKFAHQLKGAVKKAAKWSGEKIVKSIPLGGAIFTLIYSDAAWGERLARAFAGEIGAGPLDLESAYDAIRWVYKTAAEDAMRVRTPAERQRAAREIEQSRREASWVRAGYF
ncbi:SpvB/TcaC N-terminal domain-containing protein [Halomicrococcus sp. NG-SE-24]|uniref:SpvB/TcaC N-terminal domain-containing protein n=1 Tax=Halomicrococcus sp. NG-SE-24 TaxID=3436928 RepID=UPI003D973DDD